MLAVRKRPPDYHSHMAQNLLRPIFLVIFSLPAIAAAQDGLQIVKLTPSPSGNSDAAETQDITPDIHACHLPDNQKFTAQIGLTVTPSGLPVQVTLLQGTGNTCLDDSAVAAVKAATFVPATHNDVAVAQSIVKLVDMAHYDRDHTPPLKAAPGTTPPWVIRAPELDPGSCRAKKGSEYEVLVSLTVGTDGTPQHPAIARTSGDQCFDTAALKTARQYRFRPATLDGQPVSTVMNIEMQFNQR
jgi:TonB family protein